MIPGWLLLLVSVGYVGVLFAVAYYGDQRATKPRARWLRPVVYRLALAVYCSSWTFYGAVGTRGRAPASAICRSISARCCCCCSAGASSSGWC